jgi:curved DNA-binding protein CbpA
MEQTYYQVLGVEPSASPEVIKRRFRELARVHHPDVSRDKSSSHQQFVRITEAYQVLSDATRRAEYDLMLRDRAQRRAAPRAHPSSSRPPGGGMAYGTGATYRPPRPGPNPPPPHVGFRPPPNGRSGAPGGRPSTVGERAQPPPSAATRVAEAARNLREAQAAFAGLRYRDAIRLCKTVLDLDRRNAGACGLLGDIYRAQGRVDDAIYFYSLAAQLSPAPQNRSVMAKLEALLSTERGPRPGAPSAERSPEATLADGAAHLRRRASRQVCIGAFGLAVALLALLGSVQVSAEPITELPWISGWTVPLVWGMVLAGATIGATLSLAGAVRPLDEELFFTQLGRRGGAPPLGLLLFLIGGLFYYLAVGIYLLVGALQESFSRSLMRVFVATFLVICCLALMLAPEVGRQILLFGGNVVFLSMLVGWLLGDFFRPLGV